MQRERESQKKDGLKIYFSGEMTRKSLPKTEKTYIRNVIDEKDWEDRKLWKLNMTNPKRKKLKRNKKINYGIVTLSLMRYITFNLIGYRIIK